MTNSQLIVGSFTEGIKGEMGQLKVSFPRLEESTTQDTRADSK